MKYGGGEAMLTMIGILYNWIRKNEYARRKEAKRRSRVTLFKKGDKRHRRNYIEITLPLKGTVGVGEILMCKILNGKKGTMMGTRKTKYIYAGQAASRVCAKE